MYIYTYIPIILFQDRCPLEYILMEEGESYRFVSQETDSDIDIHNDMPECKNSTVGCQGDESIWTWTRWSRRGFGMHSWSKGGDCPRSIQRLRASGGSWRSQTPPAKAKSEPKAGATPKGPGPRKRRRAPEIQMAKKHCEQKEKEKTADGIKTDAIAGLRQKTTELLGQLQGDISGKFPLHYEPQRTE